MEQEKNDRRIDAVQKVLAWYRRFENVELLSSVELVKAGINSCLQGCSISAQYSVESGGIKNVELILAFPPGFPDEMPRVYLPKTERDQVGIIPHLDQSGFICTFDEGEVLFNPESPEGIAFSCLEQAISIIEKGVNGTNVEEFEAEFVAYWTEKYGEKDFVTSKCLSLVGAITQDEVNFVQLSREYGGIKYVLFQDDEFSQNFFQNLLDLGIETINQNFLYSPEFKPGHIPPFSIKSGQLLNDIQSYAGEDAGKIFHAINKGVRTVLFSLQAGGNLHFLGYKLPVAQTLRPGFRPNYFKPTGVFQTFQRNDTVDRLHFQPYSTKRRVFRSEGRSEKEYSKFNIILAGCGSIGSHLVPWIQALEKISLRLIDPEHLQVENVARHWLGLGYVGEDKVTGIKEKLIIDRPELKVETHSISILQFLIENPGITEEYDLLVVAIGNYSVERRLAELLQSGEIKCPICFIWVEPFLAAGHFLYLSTQYPIDLDSLHNQDGTFKHNLIPPTEYEKEENRLKLREGGCGSTFVPYGKMQIMQFVAAIFPKIQSLLNRPSKKSISLTWVGDQKIVEEAGVDLIPGEFKSFEILKNF